MKIFPCVFAAALLLTGCGDGSSPTLSSSPTSPSSVTPPTSMTQTGTLPPLFFKSSKIDVTRTATMTLRLTWQDPSVDIDFLLTDSMCLDADFLALLAQASSNCQLFAVSASNSGTSEVISHSVTSGESFKAWALNMSETKAQAFTMTASW
jgi:hypothetical protein